MATKTIKAWVDGAIQEIEIEDLTSPSQPLSYDDRLYILEDKPIIEDGNFLVGNGTDEMEEITPVEVLEHINGASIATLTTAEYEALEEAEETNANTLYMLTDEDTRPDLTQNDETAPDYVKGRTHWVEEGESTVIVESQTIENFQLMNGTVYAVQNAISIDPFIIGDTYKITWDGQEYELVASEEIQNGDSLPYIGNVNYVNMTSGGDIPFAILFFGSNNFIAIDSTVSDITSHTLEIVHVERIVHKIDKKFLPDVKIIGAEGTGENAEIFNDYEGNIASGDYSHAEGSGTTASGRCSHAEGDGTTASGNDGAHAEGLDTTASGNPSHAEGYKTTASGSGSHAEGWYGTASGRCSHAEGGYTVASGAQSHAEGDETRATSFCQHVQGKYNITDVSPDGSEGIGTYAHIVGNGTSSYKRSNAHTLDWEGNAWYQGDIYIGSTSGTNKDEGSKKVATEEYVDNKELITIADIDAICGASINLEN